MGPLARHRCAALLLLAFVMTTLVVSGCGGGDSGSSSSTGAEESGTIEAELKEDIATAGTACTERASGIGSEAVRKTAESACGSIQEALEKNASSAASAAQGSIDRALKELTAQCRSTASRMSFGKGAALKLCEEIEELRG